jgi:hypothetical protein
VASRRVAYTDPSIGLTVRSSATVRDASYSQPFCSAVAIASARLRAPSLCITDER